MKIIVTGNKYEHIYEPTEGEFQDMLRRTTLTVEIWNRDRPKNQRKVTVAEAWLPPFIKS